MLKTILAFSLLAMTSLSFGAREINCKDVWSHDFPGTLKLQFDERFVVAASYAENDTDFVTINELIPDPQNPYIRSGSLYQVKIMTSKGLLEAKLNVKVLDEVALSGDGFYYDLICE